MYNKTIMKVFSLKQMKKIFLAGLCFLVLMFFVGTAYSQDANYYYFKANTSLTSGKTEDAVRFYNKAISLDANFFEAYIGLSIAYRETGEYDKALESIEYAIKLKPDYYQAYYNLGLILEKQQKCEEAITAYEKFLWGVPDAARFSDVKQRISRLKGCK